MNNETPDTIKSMIRLFEESLGVRLVKTQPNSIFTSCLINLSKHLYFAGMADVRIVGISDTTVDVETVIDSYRELTVKTSQWRDSIKILALPDRLAQARTALAREVNTVIISDEDVSKMQHAKTLIAPLRILFRNHLGPQRLSPYQSRGAVTGNRFFGRDLQISAITKHPEKSYLVTGTRMSGKTSLLLEAQRRLNEAGEIAICLDCKRFSSIAGLINGVLSELEVRDSFIKLERWESPQRWHEFFKYLRTATKQAAKKHLHIFLDEYDSLVELETPGAAISWNLRALHQSNSEQRGTVQFVFAGSRSLASAARNNDSPFYNFVNPDDCFLDNFDLGIVKKVLDEPMRDLGIKIEEPDLAAEELLLETAGRPSSVQYLCSALIKQLDATRQNTVSLDMIRQVVQSPEYHHYYQGIIFENSSHLERFILTINSEKATFESGFTQESILAVARNRYKLHFELRVVFEALDNLIKSGFIVLDRSVPGRYHIAAPVIRRICRVNDPRSIVSDLVSTDIAININY